MIMHWYSDINILETIAKVCYILLFVSAVCFISGYLAKILKVLEDIKEMLR